jgi:hypothetical protein
MSSWGDHILFGNWKNKVQATSMHLLSTKRMVSMNDNVKEWDDVLMFMNECTNVMWPILFPSFQFFSKFMDRCQLRSSREDVSNKSKSKCTYVKKKCTLVIANLNYWKLWHCNQFFVINILSIKYWYFLLFTLVCWGKTFWDLI